MLLIWIYSIVAVVVISLISLFGALILFLRENILKKFLIFLVSFSAGTLIGSSFFHLLPETIKKNELNTDISLFIIIGILSFFVLEKLIRWRHCHDCYPQVEPSHSHPSPFAYTNLIGDGFHNFLDGMIIAGSFLISVPLGITTSLAVMLHEIPQEIGDFGVLLKSGLSKKWALIFNILSASVAIIGTIFALIVADKINSFSMFVVPFTIGGFIYIACADLIPELHKENSFKNSFVQLLFFIFGLVLMALL